MAKNKKQPIKLDFAFFEWLWEYYSQNRGKIRSRYKQLTKKFLDYNDPNKNENAFLRKPQFEALEIYIFIKEFLNNMQVSEMFRQWTAHEGDFSDSSYYSIHKSDGLLGQQLLIDDEHAKEQNRYLFEQMKSYQESYPNYIYALTMGLGKTILMATCIFYEFLLARKYPKESKYCHNALIFAPEKTVLQSLREIMTFDKTKVVPPEYAQILDINIKYHFLDDTNMQLNTIDDSNYNIIISNTQKIIVKKKRKKTKAVENLFDSSQSILKDFFFENEDDSFSVWDNTSLIENRRFKKLCRLPQLGIYVDEAHHLFGTALEKSLRSDKKDNTDTGKTSLRGTINLLANETNVVACFNYTGTPYIGNQVLPEVVYSCALSKAIHSGFLKEAKLYGYETVKSEEFLKSSVTDFVSQYGGNKYEYLNPKMAIYASTVEEAVTVVRPLLENILVNLNFDVNSILLNVGDSKYTKNNDIRMFNELDVPNSNGDKKQFIILVGKGTEGWNCRSLFAVAMFRKPNSPTFVLQATMRCMRQITNKQQTASIYLSKENFDILDSELHSNFDMSIIDLKNSNNKPKKRCEVRVLPPPRKIKFNFITRTYSCEELHPTEPINFKLNEIDITKYQLNIYTKDSIASGITTKKKNADDIKINKQYSKITLVAELSIYLNISCIRLSKILSEAVDGIETILKYINTYNEIIDTVIIPTIFEYLYKLVPYEKTFEQEITLLKAPTNPDYYEYHAKEELIVSNKSKFLTEEQVSKSFHADTYCFDSKPERELFYQYIKSDKVKEIYFTGMFTSSHSDFSVHYYDPESGRLRRYYPDFLVKMQDDTYQIIEVKQDNMIEDTVVTAKKIAAEQLASANKMKYIIYPGQVVMNFNVLEDISPDLSTTQMLELQKSKFSANLY